jgi:hypothetical protein
MSQPFKIKEVRVCLKNHRMCDNTFEEKERKHIDGKKENIQKEREKNIECVVFL